MSSNEYDDDDSTEIDVDDENARPSDLRAAAKRGLKFKSENQLLKRQLAFTKAGIDPDDPRMGYFVRGYDGELKPETIKQAAVEAGFLQPPVVDEQAQQQEQAGFAAQQRVMQASAGAVSEDATEGAAIARMEAALAEGGVEAMLDVARSYGVPTS